MDTHTQLGTKISCHKCKMGTIAQNMQLTRWYFSEIAPRATPGGVVVVIIIDGRPRRQTGNRDATNNSRGSQAKRNK